MERLEILGERALYEAKRIREQADLEKLVQGNATSFRTGVGRRGFVLRFSGPPAVFTTVAQAHAICDLRRHRRIGVA